MSYRILIIEDEPPAAKRLVNMIKTSPFDLEVVEILDSVEDSINYLKDFSDFDFIFMDVQLGDGLSFEIFNHVKITKPIIFTTAYDEYALQAFKVNSVDYLLKPIDQDDMDNGIQQFIDTTLSNQVQNPDMNYLIDALKNPTYKHRFLVKSGKKLVIVPTNEIRYFYSEDGYTTLAHSSGSRHIVDHTMDALVDCLDPAVFHRINRKMIVSVPSLIGIHDYFNSRLKLDIDPKTKFDVIVSRDRVKEFKNWLNG